LEFEGEPATDGGFSVEEKLLLSGRSVAGLDISQKYPNLGCGQSCTALAGYSALVGASAFEIERVHYLHALISP
jgi:hypothetical protein